MIRECKNCEHSNYYEKSCKVVCCINTPVINSSGNGAFPVMNDSDKCSHFKYNASSSIVKLTNRIMIENEELSITKDSKTGTTITLTHRGTEILTINDQSAGECATIFLKKIGNSTKEYLKNLKSI